MMAILRESFIIKMFTRNRALLKATAGRRPRSVLSGGSQAGFDPHTKATATGTLVAKRRTRPIESVIPEGRVNGRLVNRQDGKWFTENEQWYLDRGIPYRLGVLLKGPPGSGKSSTVISPSLATSGWTSPF
jgi:hypothetical protein